MGTTGAGEVNGQKDNVVGFSNGGDDFGLSVSAWCVGSRSLGRTQIASVEQEVVMGGTIV